jgi:PP-loop superfamily ATP-utilizing enzyme
MNPDTVDYSTKESMAIEAHVIKGHLVNRHVFHEARLDITMTWNVVRCYTCRRQLADWYITEKNFVEEELHESNHG